MARNSPELVESFTRPFSQLFHKHHCRVGSANVQLTDCLWERQIEQSTQPLFHVWGEWRRLSELSRLLCRGRKESYRDQLSAGRVRGKEVKRGVGGRGIEASRSGEEWSELQRLSQELCW